MPLPVHKDVCILWNLLILKQILMLYSFTATDLYILSFEQYVSFVFNLFCVLLYSRRCTIKLFMVVAWNVLKQECKVTWWNDQGLLKQHLFVICVFFCSCYFCVCLLYLCSWDIIQINKYFTELHPIITTSTTALVKCDFNSKWTK